MIDKKAIIMEAIRELNISDDPGLYKSIRRWARRYIKREPLEPIDIIGFRKGCLAVGLMKQAINLAEGGTSETIALSAYAFAEVRDYIDRWIDRGTPVYWVDDCLMGQALLVMARYYQDQAEEYQKYIGAAKKMMEFLYAHDKDAEGSLPYRPNHKNGRIFADGVGMIAPFAIMYGCMTDDEDAIELGMTQIRNFVKYGFDEQTGLPWHAYDISGGHYGDLGWGRGCGWIMYGIGAAIEACADYDTYMAISVAKELRDIRDSFSNTLLNYRNADGIYRSSIAVEDAAIDTSASAMIIYGMSAGADFDSCGADMDHAIDSLSKYVTPDGQVIQAQGECHDLGVYGAYGSYPWSVGMMLVLLAQRK